MVLVGIAASSAGSFQPTLDLLSQHQLGTPPSRGRLTAIRAQVRDPPSVLARTQVRRDADDTALAVGQATISAVGDPPCRKSTPPCMAPSLLVSVIISVR
jgi:hypothetical protein